MDYGSSVLDRVRGLKVYARGDRRAPHKPLLLLAAIAELVRGHRELGFAEVEKRLALLLAVFALPVKARHQPELPYWHLRSDGLWAVSGEEEMPLQCLTPHSQPA